jgi:hypothetical protein
LEQSLFLRLRLLARTERIDQFQLRGVGNDDFKRRYHANLGQAARACR